MSSCWHVQSVVQVPLEISWLIQSSHFTIRINKMTRTHPALFKCFLITMNWNQPVNTIINHQCLYWGQVVKGFTDRKAGFRLKRQTLFHKLEKKWLLPSCRCDFGPTCDICRYKQIPQPNWVVRSKFHYGMVQGFLLVRWRRSFAGIKAVVQQFHCWFVPAHPTMSSASP